MVLHPADGRQKSRILRLGVIIDLDTQAGTEAGSPPGQDRDLCHPVEDVTALYFLRCV